MQSCEGELTGHGELQLLHLVARRLGGAAEWPRLENHVGWQTDLRHVAASLAPKASAGRPCGHAAVLVRSVGAYSKIRNSD